MSSASAENLQHSQAVYTMRLSAAVSLSSINDDMSAYKRSN